MSQSTIEARVIGICFLAAVAASLSSSAFGWSHAISDVHGWRQAETAIRAYFIQQGGPWLGYETPVLGPPWALPHEFPLYQVAVAALANVSTLSLESAGRAVSVAFFYMALGLAYLLLGELEIAPRHRLLVLSLWMASPLYLFWSRTFMIESTALMLSMAFLTFGTRSLRHGCHADAVAALGAGALAFAVKPPTLVPFLFLAGLACLVHLHSSRYRPDRRLLVFVAVVALSLAVGRSWHQHADGLKMRNPLGWGWTSDAMWRDWVLGPPGTNAGPDVRLRADVWHLLWVRSIPESVGHFAVAVAAAVGVLVARRRRTLFAAALTTFILHFVAFTPFHQSHPYYQYAMGVFLVAAVGFAGVGLLETGDRRRYGAWLLVAGMAFSCASVYLREMKPQQQRNAYRRPAWFVSLARQLGAVTRPDEVIVGFGLDWNPEVPYYARRRALMWPSWGDLRAEGSDVARVLDQLDGWPVGALFDCAPDTPRDTLALFRDRLGLEHEPAMILPTYSQWRSCAIYTRRGSAGEPKG